MTRLVKRQKGTEMTVLWKGGELAEATGATTAPDIAISGISIDTRTLQPGDLFIALEGSSHDGTPMLRRLSAKARPVALYIAPSRRPASD